MPKYQATIPDGSTSFGYNGTTYSGGSTFESDDPCAILAFYNAFKAANTSAGRSNGTPNFWRDVEAACPTAGGTTPPPATTTPPTSGAPQPGGDSPGDQGAPAVEPTVRGGDPTTPTPGTGSDAPTVEEPTRPPDGEPHRTRGGEADAPAAEPIEGGDPIELFSGTVALGVTDLEIDHTILPLALTRTYRSGPGFYGPFGWNWDHNHNLHVRELNNGDIALWRDTHEERFVAGGGSFEPPRGVFEKLDRVAGLPHVFELTSAGGTVTRFERPAGWLDAERVPIVSMRDRHGNRLTYRYGAGDHLLEVKDDDDRFIRFEYDGCGLLVAALDSAGRRYKYVHDEETQHLVCVKGPPTGDHPDGVEKRYHYEPAFTPVSLRHNLLRVEDEDGRVYIENRYEKDPASFQYGRVTEQLYGSYRYQFRYTELQWVPAHPDHVNIHSLRVEVLDPNLALQIYTFNFRGDLLDRRYRLIEDRSFRVVVNQYEYDAQGNRTKLVHPDGGEELYTYDHTSADPRMRGRLLKKELTAASGFPSPSRIVYRASYESRYQLLVKETDESGAETRMKYDFDLTPAVPTNSGKLKEVHLPDATLPNGMPQLAKTVFEHNARGQTTAIILPDGVRHELRYGAAGNDTARLVEQERDTGGLAVVERRSYDAFGNPSETTDANGGVRRRVYNALGQVERFVRPAVGGATAEERYHYDADGRVVQVERPKGGYEGTLTDPAGTHIIDRFERDVLGYVTRAVFSSNTADSRTMEFCNDYRGIAMQTTTPDGAVIKRPHDERHLPLSEEVVGRDGKRMRSEKIYDRAGRITRNGDVYGADTHYEYDGFGRLSKLTLPNGSLRTFTWLARNLLESEETRGDDGSGNVRLLEHKEHAYDEKGRRIRTTVKTFTDNASAAVDHVTTFFYDQLDRVVRIMMPRGAEIIRAYDGLGRLRIETDPMGNEEQYVYDGNDNVVEQINRHKTPSGAVTTLSKRFEHDARNRRTAVIEPDSARVTSVYDDRDLVVERVDRLGVVTRSFYDAFNTPLRRVHDVGGLDIAHRWALDPMSRVTNYTDPTGLVSRYTYDSLGRRTKIEYPGGFVSTRSYDVNNRVDKETLGSGAELRFGYDAAGRLRTLTNSATPAPLQAIPNHELEYDGLDRLVRAKAGSESIERSYDSRGRLLSETALGVTLACSYDDTAGTVEKSWPDGRKEILSHDLNGVLSSIEQTADGGLAAGLGPLATLRPDGGGALGDIRFRGDTTVVNSYDERKRLTRITAASPAGLDQQVQYRYDAEGRRRVEALSGASAKNSYFEIDARRRLTLAKEDFAVAIPAAATQADHDAAITAVQTAAAGAAREEGFGYDDADARLKHTQTGVLDANYIYGPGHRIQSDGSGAYAHNTDGVRSSGGSLSYDVDALGRITAVKSGGSTLVELGYDALGRPSLLKEAGQPDRTLHYLGGFVEQENAGGAVERQLTLHPVTGVPIAFHTAAGTHFALVDGRFNLLGLVDTTGSLVESYRYRPFGAPEIFDPAGTPRASSAFGVPPIFGGQRYLQGPALYLSKKRLMDPAHGLFLSPDPKGYVDSPMLYAYAAQNPVDHIDPNGDVVPFIIAAFVIGGALGGAGYSFYDAYHNPSRYEGGWGTLRIFGNVFGGAAIGGLAAVAGEAVLAAGGTGLFASGGTATATSLTAGQSFVLYGTSSAATGSVLRYGFNGMFPEYVDPVTPGTMAFDYVAGGSIGAGLRILAPAVSSGAPAATTSHAPRSWFNFAGDAGGYAKITHSLGPYPGKIGAFLDKFGIRQGYASSVTNVDAAAGGSWFARTDTAVHEGFHVFVARYFPTFRNLSHGPGFWTAAARYPEEVLAYGIGHAGALRPHGIPFAPIEAFGSLSHFSPLQRYFAYGFWGTAWTAGTVGVGLGVAEAATTPNEKPPEAK
jgi:RHS repeat-associated protein